MYGWGEVSDLPQWRVIGGAYDCSNWALWSIAPPCWKYAPSAWAQMKNFKLPFSASDIKPPAAVPLAYTGKPAYEASSVADDYEQYVRETDAVIAGAAEETRAALLAHSQESSTPIPEPKPVDLSVPWYWWLVGGLGVFGLVALSAGGPRRYGR